MSFTEKIDVLDLIIKVLEEHEAKLDALITRLENRVPEKRLRKGGLSNKAQGGEAKAS